jgi:hypothetical protein
MSAKRTPTVPQAYPLRGAADYLKTRKNQRRIFPATAFKTKRGYLDGHWASPARHAGSRLNAQRRQRDRRITMLPSSYIEDPD